MNGCKDIGIRI